MIEPRPKIIFLKNCLASFLLIIRGVSDGGPREDWAPHQKYFAYLTVVFISKSKIIKFIVIDKFMSCGCHRY